MAAIAGSLLWCPDASAQVSVNTSAASGSGTANGGDIAQTNNTPVTITNQAVSALLYQADGNSPTGKGKNGGTAGSITVTNNAQINVSLSSVPSPLAAFSAQALGGQGGPNSGTATAGDGGGGGAIALSDTGPITVNAANYDGILALSRGGDGGSGKEGHGADARSVAVSLGPVNPLWATGWITMTGDNSSAIVASSTGGNADNDGGGSGSGVSVTVSGGPARAVWFLQTSGQSAEGISATSSGGFGDETNPGGNSGSVLVSATRANNASLQITTLGASSAAIDASSVAGHGGSSHGTDYVTSGDGGSGGAAGRAEVDFDGVLSTAGAGSPGIQAISIGGDGGHANPNNPPNYTYSPTVNVTSDGNGGAGGPVSVNLGLDSGATASITTQGYRSHAILAVSQGGNLGTGGTGGTVSVSTGANTAIATYGEQAAGILALSLGGGGTQFTQAVQNGLQAEGYAGPAGSVAVANAAGINSYGANSPGIVAASIAGGGGLTSWNGSTNLQFGDTTASAAAASTVSVFNSGTIVSLGGDSHGIVAQSIGGGGGVLTLEASSAASGGASAAHGGSSSGNAVSVVTTGPVLTGSVAPASGGGANSPGGEGAAGIIAQSIGGGGGVLGGAGQVTLLGATSVAGGNGGAVSVDVGATPGQTLIGGAPAASVAPGGVLTFGDDAHGVIAQSIGGGGGNGENSSGLFVALGGSGAGGGGGGTALVRIAPGSAVITAGDYAIGVDAQSIGGGGGNAGRAHAAGILGSVAIGGSGGGGGNGGATTVTSLGLVATAGTEANGILAQSIGGGGGSGGAGRAVGAAGLTLSLALGGTGGNGGSGGAVAVDNAANAVVLTEGSDSVGILAQSIGGGGGIGGAAAAKVVDYGLNLPETPAVDIAIALGATGGRGGTAVGGVNVTNSGAIATLGDGAQGMVGQSIGGGGGVGADSTALATAGHVASLTSEGGASVSVSLGGAGGAGGGGGPVTMTQTSAGAIATVGDNAIGMLGQSIGGGGGIAGIGNASAENDTEISLTTSVSLGGSGGSGNVGGAVSIENDGLIETLGSTSHGIFAQSIGGGGGMASGGTADTDGKSISAALSFGGRGGSGDNGGAVSVVNKGVIRTAGNDAAGIFAQSVGGGGGAGGSADSRAAGEPYTLVKGSMNQLLQRTQTGQIINGLVSEPVSQIKAIPSNAWNSFKSIFTGESEDDPVPAGSPWAAAPPEPSNPASSISLAFSLGLGGTGGAAGTGGAVSVENDGSIATQGERATAILAQSIGGGGGSGGTAKASTSHGTAAAGFDLGGDGGGGGDGGTVTVTNAGSILTEGYDAHGILAQSVGAGGGIGTDGSSDMNVTLHLGIGSIKASDGSTVSRASSGNGQSVTVSNTGSITTEGGDSYAILAQSVGGGGGIASAGDGTSTGAHAIAVSFGGANGISGNGGAVTINQNGAVSTSGIRALGIVAQSVGGGGGFIAEPWQAFANPSFGGGVGNGGAITINVGQGSAPVTIATTGIGAHAIFAQSIGGGGGYAADSSISQYGGVQVFGTGMGGSGNGGDITITTGPRTAITTSGGAADGIFAQSIGGGGGYVTTNGYTYAGTRFGNGAGGDISITQAGSISVGDNAHAIFAQSTGSQPGTIRLAINGTLSNSHGSSPAATIYLSGGSSANSILIGPTGSVASTSASAHVIYVDPMFAGSYALTNAGALVGNVDLGPSAANSFVNNGLYATASISGSQTSYVRGTSLANNGAIIVGSADAVTRTTLASNLALGGSATVSPFSYLGQNLDPSNRLVLASTPGTIQVGLDSVNDRSNQLAVSGNLSGTGWLSLNPITLLPNGSVTVLTVAGSTTTASLQPLQPLVFTYALSQPPPGQPGGYVLSVAQNFTSPRVSLSLNTTQAATAGMLQDVWNAPEAGWNSSFQTQVGQAFATIAKATPVSYPAMLDNLGLSTPTKEVVSDLATSTAFLNATQSCPGFTGGDSLTQEGDCVWQRTTPSWISDRGSSGGQGFTGQSVLALVGGQKQVAPGWFVGGVFGGGEDWFQSSDGREKSNGELVGGALTVKREMGAWLVAGELGGAVNVASGQRTIQLPFFTGTFTNTNTTDVVAARLRASYQFVRGNWYLKPELPVDAIYLRQEGYTETGPGALNLQIGASDKVVFAASPHLELGGRIDTSDGFKLRPYVSAGVSLLSDDHFTTNMRFAEAGAGYVGIVSRIPDVAGQFAAGIDLYHRSGVEAKLAYSTDVASRYLGQSLSLRLGYRF